MRPSVVAPQKVKQEEKNIPSVTKEERHYAVYQLGCPAKSEDLPYYSTADFKGDAAYTSFLAHEALREIARNSESTPSTAMPHQVSVRNEEDPAFGDPHEFSWQKIISPRERGQRIGISPMKNTFVFVSMITLALAIVGGTHLIGTLFSVKGNVMGVTQDGYHDLTSAVKFMSERDFSSSQSSLEEAEANFAAAVDQIDRINKGITELSQYVPGASQLYSAQQVLSASLHITRAGEALNRAIIPVDDRLAQHDDSSPEKASILSLYEQAHAEFLVIDDELQAAQDNINNVVIDDLPSEYRDRFIILKEQLPRLITITDDLTKSNEMITDLLGGNGPRKYLFLFQNNQEMRATGGFIGSYGLLDINDGIIRNFFIDGIYNPDGQLIDRIVPPRPIQKISARWSLHDSNWFAHFPTSAQKAMLFYEKTGGPTVDGVIAITPTLLEELIAVVGPIDMPEYNTTITAQNFVEKTRLEIEETNAQNLALEMESNNDRVSEEENVSEDQDDDSRDDVSEPKQILADLAPRVLEAVTSQQDLETTMRIINVIQQSMRQKHILLYARNEQAQALIEHQQLGGTLEGGTRDYLSIVNTNINGYKTDAVIDESITHDVAIMEDGSVTDTVSITRKHTGGYTDYEWWDAVNANYMRVYVPEGSQLVSVEGQTREFNDPALDYDALGFEHDPDVLAEEGSMIIDENSGTRIYNQNGKTVFANWVYVSPQESVTITYTYTLPWQIILDDQKGDGQFAAYDILYQKQHGSEGSSLISSLKYPGAMDVAWTNMSRDQQNELTLETTLTTDHYAASAFRLNY